MILTLHERVEVKKHHYEMQETVYEIEGGKLEIEGLIKAQIRRLFFDYFR